MELEMDVPGRLPVITYLGEEQVQQRFIDVSPTEHIHIYIVVDFLVRGGGSFEAEQPSSRASVLRVCSCSLCGHAVCVHVH
jgi:hypothetical protein